MISFLDPMPKMKYSWGLYVFLFLFCGLSVNDGNLDGEMMAQRVMSLKYLMKGHHSPLANTYTGRNHTPVVLKTSYALRPICYSHIEVSTMKSISTIVKI